MLRGLSWCSFPLIFMSSPTLPCGQRFYVPPLPIQRGYLAVVKHDSYWAQILCYEATSSQWTFVANVAHRGCAVVRRSDTHLCFLDVVVDLVSLQVGSLQDDQHAFDFYWTLHAARPKLELTDAPILPLAPMKQVPT